MRTFFSKSVLMCGAFSLVVLAGECQSVQAQVKAFKITGGGFTPNGIPSTVDTPAPHNAVGTATELGKYSAEGFFQLDKFIDPLNAYFSSSQPCVFIAANGDRIEFDYAGTAELFTVDGMTFTGVFTATFTPVLTPGANTGRFKKVNGGSFVMVATTAPFMFGELNVPYTWEGEGTLKFGKGK